MSFNNIPAELRARRQWVVWKHEVEPDGRPIKPPYRVDGSEKARSTDPSTWSTFEEAVAAVSGFDGIGFALSAEDPFCLIDLDGVIANGEVHSVAATIVTLLASYTERSQSGKGLHVVVRAELNGDRRRTGKTPWGDEIEMYDRERFAYLTGDVDGVATIVDRQTELDEVYAAVFPAKKAAPAAPTSSTAGDHELLARAFKAKNGDRLRVLYDGDTSRYKSASEADLALAGGLAFWAGPDPDRIERLMRGSRLVREKWDKHKSYLRDTVAEALKGRTEFWAGAKREVTDLTVEDILKAAGVDEDEAEGIESAKDLLAAPQRRAEDRRPRGRAGQGGRRRALPRRESDRLRGDRGRRPHRDAPGEVAGVLALRAQPLPPRGGDGAPEPGAQRRRGPARGPGRVRRRAAPSPPAGRRRRRCDLHRPRRRAVAGDPDHRRGLGRAGPPSGPLPPHREAWRRCRSPSGVARSTNCATCST